MNGAGRVDPTGVPNLDLVLGGGIPRGALAMVVGPPGSGKTTMAMQLAFKMAKAGHAVLILTALSEPNTKLIAHLRGFSFFDEDLLGTVIQVIALQQYLSSGLAATADAVIAEVHRTRPVLVVLDGFRGVRGAADDPQEAREFLYELGTALSVMSATLLVTSEALPRDAALFPEATTADVLVGMHYGLDGLRQRRFIEAIKVRGAATLAGLHTLVVTSAGAHVYPRLEVHVMSDHSASVPVPDVAAFDAARVPMGLPELDMLLHGGLISATSSLVLGSLGTGKTLLALHLAATSSAAGLPVLYLSFREDTRQLLHAADAFSMGRQLRASVTDATFTVLHLPPIELDIDIVGTNLLASIDRTGARVVVIDSITEIERAAERSGDPGRAGDYLAALVQALRDHAVTSLILQESHRLLAPELDVSSNAVAALVDNVLVLQQVTQGEALRRVVSVVKMRYSAHDAAVREFRITPPEGIQVLAPIERDGGQLRSIARASDRLSEKIDNRGGMASAGDANDQRTHE